MDGIQRFPRTIWRFPRTKKRSAYRDWLEEPPNPRLVPISTIRIGSLFQYEYGFEGEKRIGRLVGLTNCSATVQLNGSMHSTHWSTESTVLPILRFPRKPRRFPRT